MAWEKELVSDIMSDIQLQCREVADFDVVKFKELLATELVKLTEGPKGEPRG